MWGPLVAVYPASRKPVRLQPVSQPDYATTERWAADPDTARWLGCRQGFFSNLPEWYRLAAHDPCRCSWGIYLPHDDDQSQFIGLVTLFDIKEAGSASYGVLIGEPEVRNQGIATAVTQAVADYAFQQLKLQRLRAQVYLPNGFGLKTMLSSGYAQIGSRPTQPGNGHPNKLIFLALGRGQWEEQSQIPLP